ncbi:MAG TPA: ZIP family metal transporter [Gemmatimonadales bacterium]
MSGSVWTQTLVSVGLVSAIPLTGLVLARARADRLRRVVPLLVAFAVGALLGGAFLHLVPEAIARLGAGPGLSFLLLAGFLGFFVLEKFLWGHQHEPHGRRVAPLATLNLIGDGLHNIIDGAVIAAAYSADPKVGMAATLAVFLHEVPQELGDFGVLVYGGLPVRRAVWFNFLSGLAAMLGAAATLAVGGMAGRVTDALLPVAAGSFLYIAASDLIPELRRERHPAASVRQLGLVLSGIAVMAAPMLMR